MSKSRCFYCFYDQRMNRPFYCKRAITTRVYNACSPTHMIINDFYESYVITKNYESGKKSRFLLGLNEILNEGCRFATDFVRHFLITVLLN